MKRGNIYQYPIMVWYAIMAWYGINRISTSNGFENVKIDPSVYFPKLPVKAKLFLVNRMCTIKV